MSPPSAIEVDTGIDTTSITLPGPLTTKGVAARRAKAGKLVAGTAAYTSSDYFKGPVRYYSSPLSSVLIPVAYRQT